MSRNLPPESLPKEIRHVYSFGPYRLEARERRLLRDGAPVALPARQLDLLEALVESSGRLKTREELVEQLWPRAVVEEHSLTSRVSALRKLLGDEGDTARYIETVRGIGYRFVAPVVVETAPQAKVEAAAPARRRRFPWIAGLAAAAAIALGLALLRPTPAPRAVPRSIAVLPFDGAGEDSADVYFASGIHDMVLTRLAGIADLRVTARGSSQQLPSHPDDLAAVAAQLGVANVLQGSVRRDAERVQVEVSLSAADSGARLWSQSYTRPLADVYKIETDIATQVAAALDAHVESAEADRLAAAPTTDPRAYDEFLRAEHVAVKVEQGSANSADAFEQAKAGYRRALEHDPGFALAKARLAFLLVYGRWFGLATDAGSLTEAERLAREALGSDLPQAHLAMGYVLYWGRRDYAAALAKFERARALLPNDAAVRGAIAFIHRRQGDLDGALQGLQQAQLLDPRNPLWFTERGNTFTQLRRYDDAQREYDRALAVDPLGYRVIAYKAMTHLLAGELGPARATLDAAPAAADSTGVLVATRFRLALLERAADRALSIADAQSGDWVEEPFMSSVPTSLLRARAHALKGENDAARAAYTQALATARAELTEFPTMSYLLSVLGFAHAGRGENEDAVRLARRASEERTMEDDAFSGAPYLAALAQILAQTGDADAAVAVLRELLARPAGCVVSIPLLRTDPAWDGIRSAPAFTALVAQRTAAPPAGDVDSALAKAR